MPSSMGRTYTSFASGRAGCPGMPALHDLLVETLIIGQRPRKIAVFLISFVHSLSRRSIPMDIADGME